MTRLLIGLLTPFPLIGLLSSCMKSELQKEFLFSSRFSSQEEAHSACKLWQRKGGSWELKVTQLGLSRVDPQNSSSLPLPIKVSGTNNIPKYDPSYRKEDDELAVTLPLLSSGKYSSKTTQEETVQSIGDQWLVYERRICSTEDNMIVGKEYSVRQSARVNSSEMPLLLSKKRFPF